MRSQFIGNIKQVRECEDCIRVTKKYTKGAFSRPARHPIQGEDFPSKVLTEYYEVYPDFIEINWDMPAGRALDWLWGEVLHIDVLFNYDYRSNTGIMTVRGNDGVLKELCNGIPGLGKTIGALKPYDKKQNTVVGNSHRHRHGTITHTQPVAHPLNDKQ